MNKEFLLGFKSAGTELTHKNLTVTGSFPAWLHGTLLRNGPAKFDYLNHWFDGYAMLHRFHIAHNDILYSNQFIKSQAHKSKKIKLDEFATNAPRFLPFLHSTLTDNTNVNIMTVENKHIALTETCRYILFDPETLKTQGHFNFEDNLKGQITTAHPQYDPKKNIYYNFNIQLGLKSYYQIFKIVGTKRELLTRIPVKYPSYQHSFAMTENYIILIEPPLRLNPLKFLFSSKPFIENYAWHPREGTKLTVINKNTGDITAEFQTESFFMFHQINAYEKHHEIIMDLPIYHDNSIIQALYLKNLTQNSFPESIATRITLNLYTKKTSRETLLDYSLELPRIDKTDNTLPYHYFYAVSSKNKGEFLNQLIKVDVKMTNIKIWQEEHCYPGEPIFVMAPNQKRDDDGVILSVVLDTKQNHSFLVVLDAISFQEIARANIPHSIPFGFHGEFY